MRRGQREIIQLDRSNTVHKRVTGTFRATPILERLFLENYGSCVSCMGSGRGLPSGSKIFGVLVGNIPNR